MTQPFLRRLLQARSIGLRIVVTVIATLMIWLATRGAETVGVPPTVVANGTGFADCLAFLWLWPSARPWS